MRSCVDEGEDILVQFVQCDHAPSCTAVIARWEHIEDLAQNAEYQGGVTPLEINQEPGFGMSTVRLTVRKVSMFLHDIMVTRGA